MRLVDAVAFQKRKSMREGNNDKINNFEMEILDEGVLDKSPTVTKKTVYRIENWEKIYEVINDGYFKQWDIYFSKYFLLKYVTEYDFSCFIPVEVKKSIQQIGL